MYRAGPPAIAAVRAGTRTRSLPVRLVATSDREFRGTERDYGPEAHTYLGAVAAGYGVTYDRDLLAGRRATSLTDMALPLLRDAEALGSGPGPAGGAGPAGRIGHILLAHAAPDCDAHLSAACHLAYVAHGDPLVFSLSDQGTTVPFSAVRLMAEYLGRADGERGLVLVLDPGVLPWAVPPGTPTADRDTAVGLLLEPADPSDGLLLCQAAVPSAAAAQEVLTAHLAEVRARFGGPVTLVAGDRLVSPAVSAAVDERVDGDVVGRVCTSVWSVLHELTAADAGRTPGPGHGAGAVVVAAFDPDLGYVCALATPKARR
ncbi:hypothetical protein [Streptomyces sp. NPDC056452]|uniref:hypothetical protein n=1 Tax=Streptomyces sp. NPDC056452 TaxID=3345821 RepID=UPI003682B543